MLSYELVIEEILDHLRTKDPLPKELSKLPFAEAIWPWIQVARKRLSEKAGSQLRLLSPKARFDLEKALLQRWSTLCTPSFLLEMGIQRTTFSLQGSTSRKRYLDFVKRHCLDRDALAQMFQEYRELARLVGTFLLFWVEQAAEFLHRLDADLPLLEKTFHSNKPLGKVRSLGLEAGDLHHEGRAVSILTFTSGKSLIYKPKNLDIVQAYHALLGKLQELGLSPVLKGYTVLPRGEYGWEERVEHKPCKTKREVERYFERAGMQLCLLYLLDGSDVHYQNIIASGEHPMLIDLETLFHSKLYHPEKELAAEQVHHSVLGTGLLPSYHIGKYGEKGIDISGLGYEEESRFTFQWEHLNTDEMEFVEKKKRSSDKPLSLVFWRGAMQKAEDSLEEILKGFRKMYEFMQKHRPTLEAEGWFSRIAKHPVRVVLRPTRFYAYLLERLRSSHAILNHFQEELNPLQQSYGMGTLHFPDAVIAEERKALLRGDVPCFRSFPTSRDLFAKETLILENALEQAAVETATSRMAKMSRADRELQETFIRQSFFTKHGVVHGENASPHQKKALKKGPLPKDAEILEEATAIAKELRKRAFVSEDGSLGWIYLEPDLKTEQLRVAPISDTLFSGRMGIALFFAALAHISKEKQWEEAAFNSLKSLRKKLQQKRGSGLISTLGIGGMSGIGGTIYGLLQIGKLLSPELIEDAHYLIQSIEDKHLEEDQGDIVFGSAGLLLSLLSAYQHSPDSSILQLARSCGDSLCANWKNNFGNTKRKLLLGFSHGAAGMSYALLKLASLQNNPKYSQAANDLLAYERNHFCTESKNWPNLGHKMKTHPCAWCHGATGVGLARHASLSFSKDPEIPQEIKIATETTQAHLHHDPLCLCCGILGRLELLRETSQEPLPEEAFRSAFHQIRQVKKEKEFYNPGFMQGMAGIGYFLLRSLDKELPQVLLLR